MTNEDYNPIDPEFLVSREIDGDLSNDERRLLEEALAGSEPLRTQRDKLLALNALMQKWAERSARRTLGSSARLPCCWRRRLAGR